MRLRATVGAALVVLAGLSGCFRCQCAPTPDAADAGGTDAGRGVDSGVCTGWCFDAGEGSSYCSDGILDPGEGCDDGNLVSGDGCRSDCMPESGVCGNGIVEPDELCDGEPGCGPDCRFPCGDCGAPVLGIAESGWRPMVAHGADDYWVVAWRQLGTGSETRAMPYDGPDMIFPGSDMMLCCANVDSETLVEAGDAYLLSSIDGIGGLGRYTRYGYTLATLEAIIGDTPVLWLAADGRRDRDDAWVLLARTGTYRLRGIGFAGVPDPVVDYLGGPPEATIAVAPPPAIAVRPDGTLVVGWYDWSSPEMGFRLQLLDGSGQPAPNGVTGGFGPFPFATGATTPTFVVLEALAGGDFVAVWVDDLWALRARYYLADGIESGAEHLLASGAVATETAPDVAADADGDHVIVWSELLAGCRRIRGWVLSDVAVPHQTILAGSDAPFIASGDDCEASTPSVAVGDAGDVALAWVDGPGGTGTIRARRFPALVP